MPGSLRRAALLALTLVASALTPVAPASATVPIPPDVHDASSFQGGPSHDGHSDAVLGDHPTLRWTVRLPGRASFPVFGPGAVYVAAGFNDRSALYALSPDDGSVIWGPRYLLSISPVVAYGQGLVVTDDDSGTVQAWDATTGDLRWTSRRESMRFSESLTIANGLIYLAGNGGAFALDLVTGQLRWSSSTVSMNRGVAVAGTTAVVDGACDQAYGFDALTGAQKWHHETHCAGGGGVTPSIHLGAVNLHEYGPGFDVDLETGAPLTSEGNDATPAYDGVNEYDVAGGQYTGHAPVRARTAGLTRWTSAADYTRLVLTVTGQVIAVATDGRVDGLSQDDGRVLWSSPAPTDTVTPGDLWNAYFAGANAAGDELALSFGRVVRAYTPPGSAESVLPVPAAADVPAAVRTAAGPRGTTWSQFGADSRHDGDQSAETGHSPWAPTWSASRQGAVSQVVIVPGAVVSVSRLSSDDKSGWQLWAQDPSTGAMLWQPVTIDPGSHEFPVTWRIAAGDGIVVATDYYQASAYSIATGQKLWSSYAYGTAVVEDDLVYIGTSVLDLQTGTALYAASGVTGGEAVDHRQAYSGGDRADEGEQVWSNGIGSDLPVGLTDTRVLSRQNDELGAVTLDRKTGRITGSIGGRFLPASDGTMVVHGQDTAVVAEQIDTQRPMWTGHLDQPVAAAPVLTATEVVVLDTHGTVYALDRQDGSRLWQADVASAASTPPDAPFFPYEPTGPAVAQGLLVVPTATGFAVFQATGAAPSAGGPDAPGTPLPLVDVVDTQPKVIGQARQTHVSVVAGARTPEPAGATVDVTVRDAQGGSLTAVLAPQPDGTYRNDAVDVSLLADGPLRLQARSHLGPLTGRAVPATTTTKDTVGPKPTMSVIGDSAGTGTYSRVEMLQFWSDTDLSARPVVAVTANGKPVPGHSEWYGDYGPPTTTTYWNWGPSNWDDLVPGHYVVTATATDTYGNPTTTTTYSFDLIYDNTPPTVTLTHVPDSTTTERSATISYVIAQPGTTTSPLSAWCRLDATPTACSATTGESTVAFTDLTLGQHTFSVTANDRGGQATAQTTWTITSDTPSPSATPTPTPTTTSPPPSTPPSTSVSGPARFVVAGRWAWSTSSLVGTRDFRWRSSSFDGTAGPFTYPAEWQSLSGRAVTKAVPAGSTVCVSARTRSTAGETGPWSAERCTAGVLDDRALTAGAGWTRVTGSAYSLGTATTTTTRNADLRLTSARARHLALVVTTCATCGSLKVYLGGTLLRTLSLASSATRHGVVLDLGEIGGLRTGTLVLRAVDTRRDWVEGVGLSAV